jgi:hypothetical protein
LIIFFKKKKTKTLKNNSRQKNTKLRCKNIISGLIIKFTHQSGKICLFFFHQVAKMFQGTKKGMMKPPQGMENTQKKPNPTSKEAKSSSSHRLPQKKKKIIISSPAEVEP